MMTNLNLMDHHNIHKNILIDFSKYGTLYSLSKH